MIGALEGVSRSVEKIVEGIGMVSMQTNMLAVNGSVEAARAGDFGKGFAVVSKDIRSLARNSARTPAASKIRSGPSRIRSRPCAPKWSRSCPRPKSRTRKPRQCSPASISSKPTWRRSFPATSKSWRAPIPFSAR